MKKYITDENTGISYTLVGDVYIPNLVSTDTNYKIGYWGRKHKEYIKQYKPVFYTTLLTQCKLNSYLHDVDVRATEMYDTLVKQLAKQEGVTEKLKATDMMLWAQKMNNIHNRATEIVNEELIATVYKGNIIKNLIMDCQSYTKYRPNETTGGIFVSWRRKEELPTGA